MKLWRLSKGVFERPTSNGSESFSLIVCLDDTKFVLFIVFTLIETIWPKMWSKSLSKNAKSPLPVDVCHLKTSLLKKPWCGLSVSLVLINQYRPFNSQWLQNKLQPRWEWMRTSLDAFYHIKRVSSLPQGRGEYGRTFMNALSRKDRKILVEDSKKILEGQRPVRVLLWRLQGIWKTEII